MCALLILCGIIVISSNKKSVIENCVERNERHAVSIRTLDKVSLSMHCFAEIRDTYVLIGCSKMDFPLEGIVFCA